MTNPSQTLEENLIRLGGFSPDDVAFNRAGALSLRQKRWLTFEVAAWMLQVGIDLILMGCAWLFCYFQFQHNLDIFVIGGLFWSLALGMSLLICLEQHARPLWSDIQGNEVKSVSGVISKHFGYTRKLGGWVGVEIRGRSFSVTPSVYAALVEHQTYRLFYLPNIERLINIEPLP